MVVRKAGQVVRSGQSAAWAALGGIVTTIGIATAGWALGAPFLFFTAYVGTAMSALAGSGTNFLSSRRRTAFPSAYRLLHLSPSWPSAALPSCVAIASLAAGWCCPSQASRWPASSGWRSGTWSPVASLSRYRIMPAICCPRRHSSSSGMDAAKCCMRQPPSARASLCSRRRSLAPALLPVLPRRAAVAVGGSLAEWAGILASPGSSLFASAAIGLAGQYRLAALLATVLAGTANLDTRQIFQGADNPDYKPYYRAAIRLNEIPRQFGWPAAVFLVQSPRLHDRRSST